jgi:hypothetical protein
LSEAFAVIVIFPETFDPFAGAIIDTMGGVVSGVAELFFTLTVTAALVAEFPAASFAMARRTCVPFELLVVSHKNMYGATLSSAPAFAPSIWNCTLATPTSSAAFALTVTVFDTVAPFPGAVRDTVGGVVSTSDEVVNVISLLSEELLLASVERTRKWYVVFLLKVAITTWCDVASTGFTAVLDPYAAVVP